MNASVWLPFIAVPLFLAICALIWGAIKLSVRLGEYMAKTEASGASTAASNREMANALNKYTEKTDQRLEIHDRRLTRVETVVGIDPK
jgi:hypothetical protein